MNLQTKSPIMTIKDLSKYLGLHEVTVYRLLRMKKLKGAKVGGLWRFHKEHVDKMFKVSV